MKMKCFYKNLPKHKKIQFIAATINFKVYTGYNNDFEQKEGNMQYSNYKVTVTVGLLEENTKNSNSTAMTNSAENP